MVSKAAFFDIAEVPSWANEHDSFQGVSFAVVVMIQNTCLWVVWHLSFLEVWQVCFVRCWAQGLAWGPCSISGLCPSRFRVSSAAAAPPSPSVLSLPLPIAVYHGCPKVPHFSNTSLTLITTFFPSKEFSMPVWTPVSISWNQCPFHINVSLFLLLELKLQLT